MSSAATTPTAAVVWDIDPVHSGVHFSVKHLMVATVRGEFDQAHRHMSTWISARILSPARIEP